MYHIDKSHLVRLLAFLLLCLYSSATVAQDVVTYPQKDLYALKQMANQGDVLANYWVAHKSEVFDEKVEWYEKYAKHMKTSQSSSYLASIYDDAKEYPEKQDKEKSYYWYFITQRLCKKESYEDRWCADTAKRLPDLTHELPKSTVSELQQRTSAWLRK